jgi:hypothetical protein
MATKTARKKKPTRSATTELKYTLFAILYNANGGNGTQAAIDAGFKENSAHVSASRLLKDAKVKKLIDHHRKQSIKRAEKTADDVIRETEHLAFSRVSDVVSFNESGVVVLKSSDKMDDDVLATIESIQSGHDKEGPSFKVKMHSKPKALGMLMKHHGLDKSIIEHTGTVGVEIVKYGDSKKDTDTA